MFSFSKRFNCSSILLFSRIKSLIVSPLMVVKSYFFLILRCRISIVTNCCFANSCNFLIFSFSSFFLEESLLICCFKLCCVITSLLSIRLNLWCTFILVCFSVRVCRFTLLDLEICCCGLWIHIIMVVLTKSCSPWEILQLTEGFWGVWSLYIYWVDSMNFPLLMPPYLVEGFHIHFEMINFTEICYSVIVWKSLISSESFI